MQEIIYLQLLFKVYQFERNHMFMDKNVNLRNLLIQTEEEFTKIKFSLRLEVQYLIVKSALKA